MTLAPNAYDAEPIPEAARAEVERLLTSGDLFRYTAPADAPVSLLEAEFAELMGAKYALAKLGMCEDEVRSPLTPLTDETRALMDDAMRHAGLIN